MEFPNLGEHCSEKTCNRLDFLPLRCDACEAIFCTDHISYQGHKCPSAYKKDVQVPSCPLCNVPIPMKRGDPPDLAVGLHIDNDCQSDFGKSKKKVFSNKCSSKGCKIKEIVRVDCNECGMNFCLKHRHPVDHSCIGREEAVRLKRLEAMNRSSKSDNSSRSLDNKNSKTYKSIQGTMSDDEALARALQASMQEEERHRRQQVQPVPSESRDRCRLS
uniref:AN1-type domain-containing protein n=1 Tax=Bracon brevicornis TaxID=1563983 RepID=A0A6V7L7H3_9HYME